MKKEAEDKLSKGISEVEASRKIPVINIAIAVIVLVTLLFLFKPNVVEEAKPVSEQVFETAKNITARIAPLPEEEDVTANVGVNIMNNETNATQEPKEGTVLEIGNPITFRGREVMLTMANSRETFCRIRIDDDIILFTKGSEKLVNSVYVTVLEPDAGPPETCRVRLR